MTFFIETYVKFFFILSPFFLLSTFLSMTREFDRKRRRKTAIKVTISVVIICVVLILSGTKIFEMFGITLDSFRIGTGILLFLSAKSLVQDTDAVQAKDPSEDISVVPLAMPVTVGPATTGFLLVMGSEMPDIWQKMTGVCAIIVAIVSVGILLLISDYVEKILKRQGLAILSKITGLILAAIAAEMVMTGILGFIKQSTEIGQLP
ncbi:MAG: MarC family protein [Gammaproteobacteria bacterium]|nr:MarC family protein [Gammaproteobacteria bacterium]